MRAPKFGSIIIAVLVLTVGLVSCMSRGGKMQVITVTPSTAVVPVGSHAQFTAFATFSDGTILNWTSAVLWVSDDSKAVSVSNTLGSYGLATAQSGTTGTVTVKALDSANNILGTATVTVTEMPLVAIVISPANPVIKPFHTQDLTAIGVFADGTTGPILSSFSWKSSNPAVAEVTSTSGKVTGVAKGTATITVEDHETNVTGSTLVTVE